jgi:PAS domain S-box-containing protein
VLALPGVSLRAGEGARGLWQRSGYRTYAAAVGLGVAAIVCWAALAAILPDAGAMMVLLPWVVVAGVVCGPMPAALTAVLAGVGGLVLVPGGWLSHAPRPHANATSLAVYLGASAVLLAALQALRRAADRAAAVAEGRLAEVFRQVPAAAAILQAPDGRLLLNSARSQEVLGHGVRGGRCANDIAAYGAVDDAGQPLPADAYPIVRALKFGEVVRGEALRYLRPDGRMVDLDVHAGPVRGADGNVVAAVGMAFDVTARRDAERRQQESEAKYRAAAEQLRAAVDAAALGTWELDLSTRIMRIDAVMAAMLGLPPEATEMPQAKVRALLHPDDQPAASATFAAAIAAGGFYASEYRMVAADGSVRWLVSRGTVLKEAGRAIGVVDDTTEQRVRENALREALQARDVLMHEADHRIKNSLQLVTGVLRLQLRKTDDLVSRHALSAAIARVDAVANAHLSLQSSPDLRSIDIGPMLAGLCDRIGALNPAVEVNCLVAEGVHLDADQAIPLGLIASELLTNTLRHAFEPGAPGVVFVRTRRHAGGLELSVEDRGQGLPAAPRAPPGLGTTLVNMLARQIGAEVVTTSDPGAGVAVRVRLKIAGEEVAAEERKEGVLF